MQDARERSVEPCLVGHVEEGGSEVDPDHEMLTAGLEALGHLVQKRGLPRPLRPQDRDVVPIGDEPLDLVDESLVEDRSGHGPLRTIWSRTAASRSAASAVSKRTCRRMWLMNL